MATGRAPGGRGPLAKDVGMTGLLQTPLLCELHAHTTWSDGSQTIGQVVDAYGQAGFDVLCITDHVVRSDDPGHLPGGPPQHVHARNHSSYVMAIEIEAARARVQYDMLVLPGLELTYNDPDPLRAAHAVAVGLESFIGVDDGIEQALCQARRQGAALIAAHPYTPAVAEDAARATARFAADWRTLAPLVDRWELINRRDAFGWVAEAGLPAVATGDAHEPEHVLTWKTLMACRKGRASVIAHLRSEAPTYLVDAAAVVAAHRAAASARLTHAAS
jgi:3',5'-nucleoside bisphosphate phosphatase